MAPRTLTALAAVGFAVAAPLALAGDPSTTIGTGAKTCVLGPGADCRGVVHRWTVEHHGNLRKAKFTKADLRGADFRGADLRGADFRGAKLRHADLRGAKLKGARFDAPPKAGKQEYGGMDWGDPDRCWPHCPGADLSHAQFVETQLVDGNFAGANLSFANLMNAWLTDAILRDANLHLANLTGAYLTKANLNGASLTFANLTGASLISADLSGANLTGANLWRVEWYDTTCPNGTVTNTGC